MKDGCSSNTTLFYIANRSKTEYRKNKIVMVGQILISKYGQTKRNKPSIIQVDIKMYTLGQLLFIYYSIPTSHESDYRSGIGEESSIVECYVMSIGK
jgi:hypothetical protein